MPSARSILVSGGAGYIGSHACLALKAAGYNPVTIDNLVSGHADAVKFGPLIRGNIGDADLIARVCQEYRPVALMHFAGFIDIADSVKNPQKFLENNFEKAKILFKTCKDNDVHHIILSSTASVYGAPENNGQIKESDPLGPINPYGESKLQIENFLRGMTGMSSVIFRYFNAAGAAPIGTGIGEAHWPETHLIPCALLALLQRGPAFRIFGDDYPTPDGTAIRDYVHVSDIADAHVRALQYLMSGGQSDILNLGSGRGYSVREIIASIAEHLQQDMQIGIAPRRAGDPPVLVADTSQAMVKLGWRPTRDLSEIIASALAWHRSNTYGIFIDRTNNDKE